MTLNELSSIARFDGYCEVTFDSQNYPEKNQFYDADGTLTSYDTFVYINGLMMEEHRYKADGTAREYFLFYYDDQGRQEKSEGYSSDGEMYGYWITERDENGNFIRETKYYPDGTVAGYSQSE